MIESLGNKLAKDVWFHDRWAGAPEELRIRARAIMTVMNATETGSIADLATKARPPELRPHALKGDRKGEYAIDIMGKTNPWRITFKFKDGKFHEVKIENYH